MPKMMTFDGLAENQHTYYEDLDNGAVVQVFPGDSVPTRKVNNSERYIIAGLATESGEEDGGDGQVDIIADALREVLDRVAPLVGDPSSWTMDDMLAQVEQVRQLDTQAQEWWSQNAIPPAVSGTSPDDEDAEVRPDTTIHVDFSVPCSVNSFQAFNFSIRDASGNASDRTVTAVVADEDGEGATLTLDDDLTPGLTYRIRVYGVNSLTGRMTMTVPFLQTHGFTVDTIPVVVSASPDDEAVDVAVNTVVAVTLDRGIDTMHSSLYCVDDATEDALTLAPDVDHLVWTSSALDLDAGKVYKIRVSTATVGTNGLHLAAAFEQATGFTTAD